MLVKELLSHSTCKVRNGNFLKMRVSEIRVKRIRVNHGLGVIIGPSDGGTIISSSRRPTVLN